MVRDFISEDEQAELLALGEMADQEKWESHYMENTKKFALKKFGTDDIESLVRDGKYEITSNWVDKVLKIEDNIISKVLTERLSDLFEELDHLEVNGVGILQRQYEGVPLKAHVDNHTDPSLEYASVIYVNDDYVDGEVFFTNKGVKLKPPARALLLFPTD